MASCVAHYYGHDKERSSQSVGIGRQARFRTVCSNERVGSSPTSGTKVFSLLRVLKLLCKFEIENASFNRYVFTY